MTLTRRIAGVILAAGQSKRLGRPKQLLELGDRVMLQRVVDAAIPSSLSDVVLVLGNAHESIQDALSAGRTRIVVNEDFAKGQSTSLKRGIAALAPDVEAALMLLGDQPTISTEIIDSVTVRFVESQALIVQPEYENGPGHPVLIARELFPELMEAEGDEGARDVIRKHQDERLLFPVDGNSLPDVDNESDYQRLLNRFKHR